MVGKILISAAGSGGTNRLVESIPNYRDKFIGITADKYRVLTSVLKENLLVPHASKENEYIESINEIARRYNIDLFIPNSDLEVYVASKNIEKLQVKTFIPTHDIVDKCFDKWKLHERMMLLDIPSPKSFLVKDENAIETAFRDIKSRPLWCRVRKGSGSKFSSRVIDAEDAKCYINHCVKVYGLKINDFILSEYLPGDDLAVLTIWLNGEPKLCKMARRTKYVSFAGESPPIVIESFYSEQVEKQVIRSIKNLDNNAHGVFCVDMKCFSNGEPAITEINPGRFYYNMPLFNSGKINAFDIFLRLFFCANIDFVRDDPHVVFLREQDNEPYVVSKKKLESAEKEFWYANR